MASTTVSARGCPKIRIIGENAVHSHLPEPVHVGAVVYCEDEYFPVIGVNPIDQALIDLGERDVDRPCIQRSGQRTKRPRRSREENADPEAGSAQLAQLCTAEG